MLMMIVMMMDSGGDDDDDRCTVADSLIYLSIHPSIQPCIPPINVSYHSNSRI